MKALYRTQNGKLQLSDVHEPRLSKPEDVKIKVRYCTICSDEMRMGEAGDFFSREGIVGHEMSGEIVELGSMSQYSEFKVGDRVGVNPAYFCGNCAACRSGRTNHCADLNFINGSVCEYVLRSYRQLIKLPENVSFREACLLEPLAAVLQAVQSAKISFGSSVAVFGAGLSGLLFCRISQIIGAKSITLIEPLPERREVAKRWGAEHIFNYTGDRLYETTGVITDFNGYDVVVETSSDVRAIDTGMSIIARGGTLLLYTYYGAGTKINLNTMNMYMENLNIIFSFSSHGQFHKALELLPKLNTKELIGAEFKLKDSAKAYALQKEQRHIKIGISL